MGQKVVVGMSGGVDSSVAAYLLKEQGYDVIGVTMQIWQDEEQAALEENGGCCGLSAVDDARRVAMQLNIPYYVMNFKHEFKDKVMDYLWRNISVEEHQIPALHATGMLNGSLSYSEVSPSVLAILPQVIMQEWRN